MTEGWTLQTLEARFPAIRWREPIRIVTAFGSGFECRVCIANAGKSGSAPPRFDTQAEAADHILEAHG